MAGINRRDKPLTLKSKKGQGTLEYILILSMVVFFASAIGRSVLEGIDGGILIFGGVLEKDLRTGRMPPDAWVIPRNR